MAHILYGVHGIGHGHAIRALTVARCFPQHEFLFISDSSGYDLLHREYNVLKVPGGGSPAFQHTMPYSGVVVAYFRDLVHSRQEKRKALQAVDSFKPDVAITDYESNLPWICRTTGLPCITLDHQHIARFSHPQLPFREAMDIALLRVAMWMQFREVRDHLIISFFDAPLKTNNRAKVFPPILRQDVLARESHESDHVLAYHGYSTTDAFHSFLQSLPFPVRCYGTKKDMVVGNVRYRKTSTDHFLDDLASCRFVVCSAGNTLLSEALFYGKPVMAFPIRNAGEQVLNGYYLEKNGYGLINNAFKPSDAILEAFLNNLEYYRKNIRGVPFCGNEAVMTALGQYFLTKILIV